MAYKRAKINWKSGQGPVAQTSAKRAPVYTSEWTPDGETSERYAPHLIPGTVWIVQNPIAVVNDQLTTDEWCSSCIRTYGGDPNTIRRPGEPVIYVGMHREAMQFGGNLRSVRVMKHMFLVDGVIRYILLGSVKPMELVIKDQDDPTLV